MTLKPSLESPVHINEGVLFQELQGEAVLLNLNTGIYFGLDAVATRIWQLLQDHESLSKVVRTIVSEFEVTEERCAQDLLDFIAEMGANGLVEVD